MSRGSILSETKPFSVQHHCVLSHSNKLTLISTWLFDLMFFSCLFFFPKQAYKEWQPLTVLCYAQEAITERQNIWYLPAFQTCVMNNFLSLWKSELSCGGFCCGLCVFFEWRPRQFDMISAQGVCDPYHMTRMTYRTGRIERGSTHCCLLQGDWRESIRPNSQVCPTEAALPSHNI